MIHTLIYHARETVRYINWLYFFHAWDFPARFASIAQVHACTSCRQGWILRFPSEERPQATEAARLYDEAMAMLREWDRAGLQTRFRVSLQAANSQGDDILLHESGLRLPLLRQQHTRTDEPCLCLSDFVRPLSQGVPDRIGLFLSTAERRMETWGDGDDYHRLLAQTLADRLAEATAEMGHQEVRRRLWGYAPDEAFSPEELFQEKYQGRRPAVGYPSLPDQSLNFLLDRVLDFSSLDVSLTENGAMQPHASTSGLILAHPATRHFAVGPISEEQLLDYARRRGEDPEWLRRFMPTR